MQQRRKSKSAKCASAWYVEYSVCDVKIHLIATIVVRNN